MNTKKFTTAMDKIDDKYITEAIAYQKKSKALTWKKWAAIAACLGVAVISAFTVNYFSENQTAEQLQVAVPAQDSPMGIRKIMNFGGYRYVFMENGTSYALTSKQLDGVLGTLEYDIQSDPENNSKKDFSSTFALGGTVYKMTNYHPDFRVAVKWEDNYYICQSVGLTDNTSMNISEHFKTAGIPEIVNEISVYNHLGSELLAEIPSEKIIPLIDTLSEARPAELTNEEYQQIGKAQKEGESFQLFLTLNDGTIYKLYVIPSLKITMIGDNRYILPDEFNASFGQLFEGLSQQPLPAQ